MGCVIVEGNSLQLKCTMYMAKRDSAKIDVELLVEPFWTVCIEKKTDE